MTPVHHLATEVFTTWVQPGTTCYNHGYIKIYVMYPLRKVGTALLISFWDKTIGFQLEPENWWRRLEMPELSCWVVEVEIITKCTIINLATKTSQAFRAAKTNSAFQLVISDAAMDLHRTVPPEKWCVTYKADGWHCSTVKEVLKEVSQPIG